MVNRSLPNVRNKFPNFPDVQLSDIVRNSLLFGVWQNWVYSVYPFHHNRIYFLHFEIMNGLFFLVSVWIKNVYIVYM